ncbi:MAG: thiamine-phosphate kinase [Vulcanimicrobiaceae bacterium]
MTEDSLVAALREIVEAPASESSPGARAIVLGIGDDAAAWRPSRSHLSVVTTDALVDDVHFSSASMEPAAIGHRAMAANFSDIAAMGARPVLATIALGLTERTTEAWVLACYRGMHALATRFGARIVGGDVVRSPAISLAITVVGEVSPTRMKRRSSGRPRDTVAVTGPLGGSRAGLELRRRALDVSRDVREAADRAFSLPEPRIREARFLAASANVHAMMDSSDGLSTDLDRLARASGCGATIHDVPVAACARAVACAAGDDARGYALDGGEDFELIVSVAPRAFAHLAKHFERRFGKALLAVGTLDAAIGLRVCDATGERDLVPAGFDHLATRHDPTAR